MDDAAPDYDAATRAAMGAMSWREGGLHVPYSGGGATLGPGAAHVSAGSGDEHLMPVEVHYWFPIQIEVVGVDNALADSIAERVFEELAREFGSHA